jgi:hypothetical protein
MSEKIYDLQTILNSFITYKKPKAKKKLLFDQTQLGGIAKKWIIAFFILLPFLNYMGIFQTFIFDMLGIAQAVVFFVVFMSMIMIMIAVLTFINNNAVIRKITPSWKHYFPKVDLKMILSGNSSPYKDFYKHYAKARNENLEGEALQQKLQEAFDQMEKENSHMMESINRGKRDAN